MTKPTPAQIEAALDAISPSTVSRADMKAALTAAGEVEDRKKFVMGAFATPPANLGVTANTSLSATGPKDAIEWQTWAMEVEARTIERCAKEIEGRYFKHINDAAAAIRALMQTKGETTNG